MVSTHLMLAVVLVYVDEWKFESYRQSLVIENNKIEESMCLRSV